LSERATSGLSKYRKGVAQEENDNRPHYRQNSIANQLFPFRLIFLKGHGTTRDCHFREENAA